MSPYLVSFAVYVILSSFFNCNSLSFWSSRIVTITSETKDFEECFTLTVYDPIVSLTLATVPDQVTYFPLKWSSKKLSFCKEVAVESKYGVKSEKEVLTISLAGSAELCVSFAGSELLEGVTVVVSLGASEDEHPAATTEASKTNRIRYVPAAE